MHIVEVLVFLAAIGGYWRRWGEIGLSFALAVIGTIQLGLADGDDWVGGLHGVFALLVLILAGVDHPPHHAGPGRRAPRARPGPA